MLRPLFTVASVLSLLVVVAFTALWVASYHGYFGLSVVDDTHLEDSVWQDWFIDRGKAGSVSASYDGGMSNLESFENRGHHRKWTVCGPAPVIVNQAEFEAELGMVDWSFAGFSATHAPNGGYSVTLAPLWPIMVLALVLPCFRVARLFPRRRSAGRCPVCGYDLRASKDRCPECGTAIGSTAMPAEKSTISN